MFTELLHQPSQKYFIEAIDAHFDSEREDNGKLVQPEALCLFDEIEVIEGNLEQLNVKFFESLIEEEASSISTEIDSDENESLGEDKHKIVPIQDYFSFTPEALKKFKSDYTINIQFQYQLFNQYAQRMQASLFKQQTLMSHQTPTLKDDQAIQEQSPITSSGKSHFKAHINNKYDCPLNNEFTSKQ